MTESLISNGKLSSVLPLTVCDVVSRFEREQDRSVDDNFVHPAAGLRALPGLPYIMAVLTGRVDDGRRCKDIVQRRPGKNNHVFISMLVLFKLV